MEIKVAREVHIWGSQVVTLTCWMLLMVWLVWSSLSVGCLTLWGRTSAWIVSIAKALWIKSSCACWVGRGIILTGSIRHFMRRLAWVNYINSILLCTIAMAIVLGRVAVVELTISVMLMVSAIVWVIALSWSINVHMMARASATKIWALWTTWEVARVDVGCIAIRATRVSLLVVLHLMATSLVLVVGIALIMTVVVMVRLLLLSLLCLMVAITILLSVCIFNMRCLNNIVVNVLLLGLIAMLFKVLGLLLLWRGCLLHIIAVISISACLS